MQVEYIKPFISSAQMIFEKEIHVNLERRSIVRRDDPSPTMPVSIVIGVSGAVSGQVVFSMDRDFAYFVAEAMMINKSPSKVEQMVSSAVGEVANMITGRASMELAKDDELIGITPPAVFTGPNPGIDFLHIPTIYLSFISEIGALGISLALRENTREVEDA